VRYTIARSERYTFHLTTNRGRAQHVALTCGPSAGVHQRYRHRYVATYDAMVKTTRGTPELIRRMCVRRGSAHSSYA
jgi:hypothetical protein